jgi:predicted ABC-type exoprotein transport system permease subunit
MSVGARVFLPPHHEKLFNYLIALRLGGVFSAFRVSASLPIYPLDSTSLF